MNDSDRGTSLPSDKKHFHPLAGRSCPGWFQAAVLIVTLVGSVPDSRAGLAIEAVQRSVQQRWGAVGNSYFAKSGVVDFPPRSSDGAKPEPLPPDGFYCDDQEDEIKLKALVQDLENKVFYLAGKFSAIDDIDGSDRGIGTAPIGWPIFTENDPQAFPKVSERISPLPADAPLPERLKRCHEALLLMKTAPVDVGMYYQREDGSLAGFIYEKGVEGLNPILAPGSAYPDAVAKWNAAPWHDLSAEGAFLPDLQDCGNQFSCYSDNSIQGFDPGQGSSNLRGRAGSCVYDLGASKGTIVLYIQVDSYGGSVLLGNAPAPDDAKWHSYDTKGGSGLLVFKPIGMDAPPAQVSGFTSAWWNVRRLAGIFKGEFQDDWKDECTSCGCQGDHGTKAGVGSIDYTFYFGKADQGRTAARLNLHADKPFADLCQPKSLSIVTGSGVTIVRAADGTPRQVVTDSTLIDLVVLNDHKFQIAEYPRTSAGAPQADGTFALSGNPARTATVERPDLDANKVLITLRQGQTVLDDIAYDYDPATTAWGMTRANGTYREVLTPSWNADHTEQTKRRQIFGPNATLVQDTAETFHAFPWGQELVRRVVDPAGAALTTTWQYFENPTQPGRYSRPKLRVDPTGYWEAFDYDTYGQQTKLVAQVGDTAPNSPEAQNRVVTTAYATVNPARTEIETVGGVETKRRYVAFFGTETRQIECQRPGAAWDAADNLVTSSVTTYDGPAGGETQRTRLPDGTLSVTATTPLGSNQKMTVTSIGAPNPAGTAVVDGTRTTSTVDAGGNPLFQLVEDVKSGLLLSSAVTTQTDGFDRPTRIDYEDGTSERTSYGCCGLDSRTDRNGVTTTYTYDRLGRQATEIRAGIMTISVYDAAGNRTATIREGSDGTHMTLESAAYDVAGRVTATADGLGKATSYAETTDASGHLVKTTTLPDGLGTRVETYAQDGSLLGVGGTAAHPLARAYGVEAGAGRWRQEFRVGDQGQRTEWTKTYADALGRDFKSVSSAGAVTQSFFNAHGQLERAVDPDGVTLLYAYNARGEQETVAVDMNHNGVIDYGGTDRITRTERSVATARGTVIRRAGTSRWMSAGNNSATMVAVADQSADGRRSWQTVDGLTTASVLNCDGVGGCTTIVTAPDGSWTSAFSQNGRAMNQRRFDAAGRQLWATFNHYDAHGRLDRQTDARIGDTTFTYYASDALQSVSHAGRTTAYVYDALGRKRQETSPDGGLVNSDYWPGGELKSVAGARTYAQAYTYDSQGRVKMLTTGGAVGPATTTWNYDPASGQLAAKLYTDNHGPAYTYTVGGRLLSRTWARGVTAAYGYNAAGELETITYSDGGATAPASYGRDRAGRLSSISGGGTTRTLSYVGATGLLASDAATAGSTAGLGVELGYDGLLRRSGLVARSGANAMFSQGLTYDSTSRLATASQGSAAVTYTYVKDSVAGLIDSISYRGAAGGSPVLRASRRYDALDRLQSITHTTLAAGQSSEPIPGFTYGYNLAGQRERATLADGTRWSYGYDNLGQLTAATKTWDDGSPVAGQQFGFNFDAIGNRTQTSANGRVSLYAPNNLNQYSQRTVPGAVDVLGRAEPGAKVTVNGESPVQRGSGGYFYRGLAVDNAAAAVDQAVEVRGVRPEADAAGHDALTEETGRVFVAQTPESFAYDLDGNLVQDGRWVYSWDAENRLVGMEVRAELPATARVKLAFAYDLLGRRTAKQVWNWDEHTNSYQPQGAILFLYDGWNLVAEVDGTSGNPLRSYLWGTDLSGTAQGAGGVGGLLTVTNHTQPQTPESHFACYDGNGNVVALVRAQNGTVSATYEYEPLGDPLRITGSAIARANPIRWSSKYTDQESGLCYYGYRFYQPQTGRWVSKDPIEERGGTNLYGFVNNDPTNNIDYLGNFAFAQAIEGLVRKYAQPQGGGVDFAADVPGTPMPLAFLPGAPMLRVIFTGTINVNRCCKKDGSTGLYAYASGGIEAYLQWGWTWQTSKKSHTPFGPMETFRQTPNKGYKERSGHGDVGQLAPCPEKRFEWVQWTLYAFLRGSIGAGVGLQGSFSSSVSQGEDFTFNTLWNNFNAQGSVAWGVAGGSVELGLGGNTTGKLLIK